jgi:hypothetical protein
VFGIGKSQFVLDHIFIDHEQQCKGYAELYDQEYRKYAEIDVMFSNNKAYLPLVYTCYCYEYKIGIKGVFTDSFCSSFTLI